MLLHGILSDHPRLFGVQKHWETASNLMAMICMIVKSQGQPLASWLLARDVALHRFLSGKDSQSKDDFDMSDGDLVDVPIVVEWDLNG